MTATVTSDPGLAPELAPYVAAVRALWGRVPPADRDELLDDAVAHLSEVAAEAVDEGADLRVLLGPPTVYATDLIAAAGYEVAAAPTPADARPSPLRTWWDGDGGEAVRQLAVEVRPGWWAIRPFLIGAGVLAAIGSARLADELGAQLVAVAVGVLLVGQSMAWGRAAARRPWRNRTATLAALVGLALAINALMGLPRYRFVSDGGWSPPGVLTRGDGTSVSNIHAYDRAGNPVEVFLYDQDGRPLDDAALTGGDVPLDANGAPLLHLYPRPADRLPPTIVLPPTTVAVGQDEATTTGPSSASATAGASSTTSSP